MLKVGDTAPNFTLPDQRGEMLSLSELRGKRVVLYFYPRDNTSGCTRQACAFAASHAALTAAGAVVVGISRDSTESHLKFAQKYGLPFTLLSDPGREAIEAYGVWQEKKQCGRVSMGIVRTTFVIGPDGRIEHVMPKVKPETNAEQILALLG